LTEVVYPNGSVNEDHSGRRRGTCFIPGSLPPSRARRREASRWISARNASRIRAVFSVKPVNSVAVSTRSSSRDIVVRMVTSAFILASFDVLFRAL
jgi:hypothetical protein